MNEELRIKSEEWRSEEVEKWRSGEVENGRVDNRRQSVVKDDKGGQIDRLLRGPGGMAYFACG